MLERVNDEGRLVAGRYRLLSPLGTGGMGTVWRAEDVLLAREVAVKEVVLPPGLSEVEREHLRERTRREARSAARLDHPSAVTIYDVVEEDGHPFLVMELVQARTLAEVLRTDGPLSPTRTAAVGLAVLGALEAAHAQGIVHRDVKPGNVMLRPDGRVVLTDFGIARRAGDSSITGTGLLLGSPSYISPERAKGQEPGPASDLWSLGATLFTAVEGRPPYDTGDPITTMTSVVLGEHAPFLAAGPLEPVLEGLLTKDPEARLGTAAARSALQAVALQAEARPAVPRRAVTGTASERRTEQTSVFRLGALPAPAPGRRRARALVAVAGLLVVLVGLGVVGYLASSRGRGGVAVGDLVRSASPGPSDAPVVPAGWLTYRDPAGWSVSHPPDWAEGSFQGLRQLRDEQAGRVLRVDTSPLGSNVQAAVRGTADRFRVRYPSYVELGLAPDAASGAVLWEFTYRDGGADLHARVRSFQAGGRSYALLFQTKTRDWAASMALGNQLTASFRPA